MAKVGGQRLASSEVNKRVIITVDNSITSDGVNGVMKFGEDNNYPQLMEKLINSSITAKAVSSMYSKFLTGSSFTDKNLNGLIVGKDVRGKGITLLSLLRQISDSISKFNGFYVHRSVNKVGEIGNVHLKPFKNCRFSTPDDSGYSAKILEYNNWDKDSDIGNFDAEKITSYNIYSNDNSIKKAQLKDDNFKGQIFFEFLDNQYFYPLSCFDSVYLDCDNEAQLTLFRNRQFRDGFLNKVIFRIAPQNEEQPVDADNPIPDYSQGKDDISTALVEMMGVDGNNVVVLTDAFDPETGELSKNGGFQVDEIKTNINDKLFESWEKNLANNIRKSVRGIPAILIDYEESKLGGTSGEAIIQAVNFYNAVTKDDRDLISNALKEIFLDSVIPYIKNKDDIDWSIEPLKLL